MQLRHSRQLLKHIVNQHLVSSIAYLVSLSSSATSLIFCPKLPDEVALGMRQSLSLVGLRKEGRREEVFMSAFKV